MRLTTSRLSAEARAERLGRARSGKQTWGGGGGVSSVEEKAGGGDQVVGRGDVECRNERTGGSVCVCEKRKSAIEWTGVDSSN